MKIGVNARLLCEPFTGIGQYTLNMFRELAKIDPSNEYILVVPKKVDASFPSNVRVEVVKQRLLGTAGMKKTWWEQIALPEFFEKEGVDIAFYTYPSIPWTKDWYAKGIKTVVAIHDCIPWMRKSYRRGLMSKMYHYRNKKAVARASLVFTVSEVSKKDIVKVCGVEPERVHVVYNDASPFYKLLMPRVEIAEVLRRFSLKDDQFFLYVGGYDERKNVGYLKNEHDAYVKEGGELPLVLIGGKLHKGKLYRSYDGGDNVVKTGFLDEKSLAALYRSCSAFVNVSDQEGFNIPILEAANSSAPLILSDIPVHREVAHPAIGGGSSTGNAALFVNIGKKGALKDAFKKMSLEANQERFSADSAALARKYSWASSAQKVKDMLFS
ncbi:MAG: glycosyltransferase family 1 protein [Nitrospirota bacterium]